MIPRAHLTEWSRRVPWPEVNQVEQDLVLKRLVVEIFRDDLLSQELAFWGGTCLHALMLAPLLATSAPKYDAGEALARVRREVLDVLDA
ncbi:MAG: hypothetical protein K8T90_04230 [Planctomycetes bacterium]|nr:hypothetical protein [Planctomycetota bacterium]